MLQYKHDGHHFKRFILTKPCWQPLFYRISDLELVVLTKNRLNWIRIMATNQTSYSNDVTGRIKLTHCQIHWSRDLGPKQSQVLEAPVALVIIKFYISWSDRSTLIYKIDRHSCTFHHVLPTLPLYLYSSDIFIHACSVSRIHLTVSSSFWDPLIFPLVLSILCLRHSYRSRV